MGAMDTDLKDQADAEAEVEMTPLIDIVFNLLIFFMTSMKFKTTEGQIQSYLPKDQGQATSTPENVRNDEVRVKLLWVQQSDGVTPTESEEAGMCALKIDRMYFETATYADDHIPSPDFRRLTEFLRGQLAEQGSDLPVIIDARTLVPWKYVVRALNSCVRAGVTDVKFAQPEIPY